MEVKLDSWISVYKNEVHRRPHIADENIIKKKKIEKKKIKTGLRRLCKVYKKKLSVDRKHF